MDLRQGADLPARIRVQGFALSQVELPLPPQMAFLELLAAAAGAGIVPPHPGQIFHALILDDVGFKGVIRPDRHRTGFPVFRVIAVPIRGVRLYGLHGPVPTPHKIAAFVVEADILKGRPPGGGVRSFPFFHFLPAVGANGFTFIDLHKQPSFYQDVFTDQGKTLV